MSNDILTHIALHMIPENAKKDSVIHQEKTIVQRQACTELKILYKGQISLSLIVDKDTELTIETLGKGAVLDAHNFLCQRYHRLNVKCVQSCMFYYLPY